MLSGLKPFRRRRGVAVIETIKGSLRRICKPVVRPLKRPAAFCENLQDGSPATRSRCSCNAFVEFGSFFDHSQQTANSHQLTHHAAARDVAQRECVDCVSHAVEIIFAHGQVAAFKAQSHLVSCYARFVRYVNGDLDPLCQCSVPHLQRDLPTLRGRSSPHRNRRNDGSHRPYRLDPCSSRLRPKRPEKVVVRDAGLKECEQPGPAKRRANPICRLHNGQAAMTGGVWP